MAEIPNGSDAWSLTRERKLDLIWSGTHPDFRGIAGEANPAAWPAEYIGRRTILVYKRGVGTVLKLLDELTDEEIARKLSFARCMIGTPSSESEINCGMAP